MIVSKGKQSMIGFWSLVELNLKKVAQYFMSRSFYILAIKSQRYTLLVEV